MIKFDKVVEAWAGQLSAPPFGTIAESIIMEPWTQLVMDSNLPHSGGPPRLGQDPFDPEHMTTLGMLRLHFYTGQPGEVVAQLDENDKTQRKSTTDPMHHLFGVNTARAARLMTLPAWGRGVGEGALKAAAEAEPRLSVKQREAMFYNYLKGRV